MRKIILKALILSLIIGIFGQPITSQAKENIVIMIDPGHGGANLGANPTGYVEKDITFIANTIDTGNTVNYQRYKENNCIYANRL